MDEETQQALEESKKVVADIKEVISELPVSRQNRIALYHDTFVKMVNNDDDASVALALVGAELQVESFN